MQSKIVAGNLVRVVQVPPSLVGSTEEHLRETVSIFTRCVGQVLRVERIESRGDLALNVRDDGSQAPNWCFHTLYIEPECVELFATPPRMQTTRRPRRRM